MGKEEAKLTISSDAPESSLFLLGNEAIARGAIEAGVQVVSAYPGTPSSEIAAALIESAKDLHFKAQWAVNEKVAMEVAIGASFCGVRSMAIMKQVGVNVAMDPLMSVTYMGAKGGLVLVDAEDPGQWSSQTEQDNRFIAEEGYIPVLEPSSPQEAKDMTRDAFEYSEKYGQIFMLRTVTRISHARGDIRLGEINKNRPAGEFIRNADFVCMPNVMRKHRVSMLERFARIKEDVNSFPYNQLRLVKGARLGIIACGLSYAYALEAIRWLGLEDKVSLLKIGTPHPLPGTMVKQLISSVPEVLIVEELEPFVENHVKIIAQESDIRVKIHGKDVVPVRLELSTRKVAEAIIKLTNVTPPYNFSTIDKRVEEVAPLLPVRPPTLCAGCPHRATFYSINVAARKVKKDLGEKVLTGDIGCYSLAVYPPLNSDETSLCMGSGFGIPGGIAKAVHQPVIGHLGDSTFFHSGIPPMINAVFNNDKIVMVILDNSITAMTGFQPNPGHFTDTVLSIKPEDIARACGIKFVEVTDPFDVKNTVKLLEKAIRFDGPSVVIMRRTCAIVAQRHRRSQGIKVKPYHVDLDKCSDCRLCIDSLGCPAITIEDERVTIEMSQCDGCGVCAQVCPKEAIVQERIE